MPEGENDPSPENFEVKEFSLLPSLIDNRVFENKLIVDILVDAVCEQTLPRGPNGVVHGR